MSECRPITGELRNMPQRYDNFANVEKVVFNGEDFDRLCDAIDIIHASLEVENERLKAELDRARGEWDFWESTHVELPKDADGVPIHIGDVLERGERHGEVIALMLSDNPWGDGNHWAIQLEGEHAPTVFDSLFHRYVPDTWERIIEDAIDAVDDCWANDEHDKLVDALVARCKALAGDAE